MAVATWAHVAVGYCLTLLVMQRQEHQLRTAWAAAHGLPPPSTKPVLSGERAHVLMLAQAAPLLWWSAVACASAICGVAQC